MFMFMDFFTWHYYIYGKNNYLFNTSTLDATNIAEWLHYVYKRKLHCVIKAIALMCVLELFFFIYIVFEDVNLCYLLDY